MKAHVELPSPNQSQPASNRVYFCRQPGYGRWTGFRTVLLAYKMACSSLVSVQRLFNSVLHLQFTYSIRFSRMSALGIVTMEEESENRNHAPVSEDGKEVNGRSFTLQELELATWCFSSENFLGQGKHCKFYKGFLAAVKQMVFICQLYDEELSPAEFLALVEARGQLHNPNIANFMGYCAEGSNMFLMYEHMPNKSLYHHLHGHSSGTRVLDWRTRVFIAAGAARGLEYWHTEVELPIIYGDISSSSILLDEHYKPKWSDFALVSDMEIIDGYSAPEGHLSEDSEIYSFGILIFELFTGKKASGNLVPWARSLLHKEAYKDMVDPLLGGMYSAEGLVYILKFAEACTQVQPDQRPASSSLKKTFDRLLAISYEYESAPEV